MPTEMGDLLSTGTLYLQNEDGSFTPFVGLGEAAFLGCTEGTINFVDDIPVVQEMTFAITIKRPKRAWLRALGFRSRLFRSKKSIERPIRRIMRLKEKHRRYLLKRRTTK
jgi:hypothetical protein